MRHDLAYTTSVSRKKIKIMTFSNIPSQQKVKIKTGRSKNDNHTHKTPQQKLTRSVQVNYTPKQITPFSFSVKTNMKIKTGGSGNDTHTQMAPRQKLTHSAQVYYTSQK